MSGKYNQFSSMPNGLSKFQGFHNSNLDNPVFISSPLSPSKMNNILELPKSNNEKKPDINQIQINKNEYLNNIISMEKNTLLKKCKSIRKNDILIYNIDMNNETESTFKEKYKDINKTNVTQESPLDSMKIISSEYINISKIPKERISNNNQMRNEHENNEDNSNMDKNTTNNIINPNSSNKNNLEKINLKQHGLTGLFDKTTISINAGEKVDVGNKNKQAQLDFIQKLIKSTKSTIESVHEQNNSIK